MAGYIRYHDPAKRWLVGFRWQGKEERFWRYNGEPLYDKRTATKLLSKIQADVDNGTFYPRTYRPDSPLSLKEYSKIWLETSSACKNTKKIYRNAISKAVEFFGPDHDIRHFTHSKLLLFMQSLNLSDSAKYNVLTSLKTMLRFYRRDVPSFVLPVFPPLTKGAPESTAYLTFDEQQNVLDAIPERHRTNTHARRQELSFHEREQSLEILARILGPVPIIQVDRHSIATYQKTRSQHITRTKRRVTNRTINKELSYLASFLNWARRAKEIPVPPLKIDMLPHQRPRPIILSPDEVVRLVAEAEPFYRAFFLCLYTLGFRLTEATYIRWRDVDRDGKTISAIQKGGSLKIEPLNAWLDAALQALKKETEKKTKRKVTPDEYVFFNPRTGRPVMDIRTPLERAAKAAGIIKHVTPHLLRHSIATHLLARGKNLRTIQAMLGHAQVGTTEWYTHVVTEDIREATAGLFDEMRGKQGQKKALTRR